MNKTEFVMVPRDTIEEICANCCHLPPTKSIISSLNEILAKPAVHQGEPVAWLVKCKQSGLVEQAEPNEKASNPEHWTDAFPVYDSPKSARSQFDYDRGFAAGTGECETLRAQLAELEALCWGLIGSSGKKRAQYLEKLQASISASAEPSAPKCGNCGASSGQACNDKGCGYLEAGSGQACNDKGCGYLEAGNGEPSAPVEITDEQIIEAMRSDLNSADGGYVIDTAPDDVVKTGRALLACAGSGAQVERDERAAFEADFKARYPDTMHDIELGKNAEGDYLMTPACFEWEGWKARASLEQPK